MSHVSASDAAKFVALRRRLLLAELETAILVGRNSDAGIIRGELRSLEVFPYDALMSRVSIGRTVARSASARSALPSLKDFEREMEAVQRRLSELAAEVRTWRANRSRG